MLPYKTQKCRLTSKYGYRIHPITGLRHFHGGVDLVGKKGEKIVAVRGGVVVRSRIVTNKNDATWQWGEYIAITGDDGRTLYYCHLEKRLVKVGDRVKAGDIIGIQGTTGQSTGHHLHFEVRYGTKQENSAEYLGIDNALGSYDGVVVALKRLASLGIISSPEYWVKNVGAVKYLDELIVKADAAIERAYAPCESLSEALRSLCDSGVINTPEYWERNADKLPYLPELIMKLGGSVDK